MVINAVKFFLRLPSFLCDGESPGLESQGLQVMLCLLPSASRTLPFSIAPEDVPSALAMDGSSYPSHAPGEGTSPSLTSFVKPWSIGASLPGPVCRDAPVGSTQGAVSRQSCSTQPSSPGQARWRGSMYPSEGDALFGK